MANLDHPGVNPENRPYFEALAEGRLLLKTCGACGKPHFYPRAACPHCHSQATEWLAAKGTGAIYSFSVMRRLTPPLAVAYVTLDEGVSMFTNIVDSDVDALTIGQRVRFEARTADDGLPMAVFVPD